MLAEVRKMKYIINNIQVWDEFRKEMGDNEETGDKNITYYIAPSTTEEAVIHYLETNGDPVYLGWASPGKDGAEETIEEYDEEIREWLSEEGWLNRLLGYPRLRTRKQRKKGLGKEAKGKSMLTGM